MYYMFNQSKKIGRYVNPKSENPFTGSSVIDNITINYGSAQRKRGLNDPIVHLNVKKVPKINSIMAIISISGRFLKPIKYIS